VEVAIALGIAAFCLLTVMGLLPVGLDSIRKSRDEDGAARCLEQITQALRTATLTANGQCQASGSYSLLVWTPEDGLVSTLENLSVEGAPEATLADQRLTARVEIAPAAGEAVNQAFVTVAWPNHATWDASSAIWKNAQGSISTWVVFRYPN